MTYSYDRRATTPSFDPDEIEKHILDTLRKKREPGDVGRASKDDPSKRLISYGITIYGVKYGTKYKFKDLAPVLSKLIKERKVGVYNLPGDSSDIQRGVEVGTHQSPLQNIHWGLFCLAKDTPKPRKRIAQER